MRGPRHAPTTSIGYINRMRTIWLLFLAVIVFFAGVLVGRSQLPPAPSGGQVMDCPQVPPDSSLASMRSKMQLIADTDFAEYQRLKSQEEKYKKADEILTKIMAIFLADLGLHFKPQRSVVTGSAPPAVTSPVAESPAQARQRQNAKPLAKPAPATPAAKDARSVSDLHGPQDESNFLTANKIDDIEQALRGQGVGLISAERLADLNGTYQGSADVQSGGKPHAWEVTISVNAHYDGDKIGGNSSIALAENGKPFSTSGTDGNITSFKESQTDRQVLFIRASPTTYFQMYKNGDSLFGNVYSRPDAELPFAFIGTVNVQRVH